MKCESCGSKKLPKRDIYRLLRCPDCSKLLVVRVNLKQEIKISSKGA